MSLNGNAGFLLNLRIPHRTMDLHQTLARPSVALHFLQIILTASVVVGTTCGGTFTVSKVVWYPSTYNPVQITHVGN